MQNLRPSSSYYLSNAYLTAAHKNCEKVKMQPDKTRMTNVTMKPSSMNENKVYFLIDGFLRLM